MSDPTAITLDHVAIGYERDIVLSDINLQIHRGTFTGLLGANGSGKSTLLKTIIGIVPPVAGRISLPPMGGRAVIVGYVPQRESLDPIHLFSSFEVVLMGVCGRVGPGRRTGSEERDFVRQCLRESGAEDLGGRRFSLLSGGQKQRVLIARALATKPDLLLLDEPTAGIDAAATQSIMELLQNLHRQRGLTILMVSHDLPTVRRYVERVIWIHQGRLLHGTAKELLSREKIEEILDLNAH